MKRLLVTMRPGRKSREARQGLIDEVCDALDGLDARLIGSPGYSMRIAVAPGDVGELREQLGNNFIIEDDYVLETFHRGPGFSAAGRIPAGPRSTSARGR